MNDVIIMRSTVHGDVSKADAQYVQHSYKNEQEYKISSPHFLITYSYK